MKIVLNELTPDQVIGINRRVIVDAHHRDLDRPTVNDLMWGFAAGEGGVAAKYGELDAVQFVFDNVMPHA